MFLGQWHLLVINVVKQCPTEAPELSTIPAKYDTKRSATLRYQGVRSIGGSEAVIAINSGKHYGVVGVELERGGLEKLYGTNVLRLLGSANRR